MTIGNEALPRYVDQIMATSQVGEICKTISLNKSI